MFIDRAEELCLLDRLWQSNESELFVLYGRRRVGKSALLRKFCCGKRHIYFVASEIGDQLNLAQFKEAASASLCDPFLQSVAFPNWFATLKYTARASEVGRLLVVIDDFPSLCKSNRAIPWVFQRFWETEGCYANLMFVLCGSNTRFMEKVVLGENSPLFGRRTSQRKLEPLPYYEAAKFFLNYPPKDKLKAYGMLGGIPAYLEKFDPDQSLKDNVIRQMLSPGGFLRDEAMFLLRMELAEISKYASIIGAIASGAIRFTQVADRSRIPVTALTKYLSSLMAMGLVERRESILEWTDEKHSETTLCYGSNLYHGTSLYHGASPYHRTNLYRGAGLYSGTSLYEEDYPESRSAFVERASGTAGTALFNEVDYAPLFEHVADRRQRGRYYIADKYINFWFRFVQRNLSLIEGDGPRVAYELKIEPYIDDYMNRIFKDICCDFVKHRWHTVYGEHVIRVGEYWGNRFDIDVVAELDDGRYLIGECKWWNRPVGFDVLRDLLTRGNLLRVEAGLTRAGLGSDVRLVSQRGGLEEGLTAVPVIFSSSGFTEELTELGHKGTVRLVSLEMLLD
ncbi:MAG TPA: ATP-binding protein [Clostridia bacterium]|nr:ATP-binding protein [Clostridia bacterium]